ncbi:hypothetical protein ACFFU9_10940 [Mariniflexile ostreae]|uniref:Lipoprotein n=1 Tax=Mariniflexile ostreae TaxID=1520892 RepID=A0ABV5FCT1_9FLAO
MLRINELTDIPFTVVENTASFRLIFILAFMFCSCGSIKAPSAPSSRVAKNPKIIFLNYSIKKTADGSPHLLFLDKIVVDGQLKDTPPKETGSSGDLVCLQLDKKSKVLQRNTIKNPLIKMLEYVDKSHSFQKKQIHLDSTKFSIRLQLNPKAQYIVVFDSNVSDNQKKALIKTRIK